MNTVFQKIGRRLSVIIGLASAFFVSPVFAQTVAPTISIGPSFVTKTFCSVMVWMFFIVTVACTVMILYGAYLYLTAGDDTEKVHTAGKTILYAAIAIFVTLIARSFPQTIAGLFGLTAGSTC